MPTRSSQGKVVINRRTLMVGGLGLAATSLVGGRPACADAATVHRFKHGANEIIVVSDGHLLIPARLAAPDVDAKEREAAQALAGQTGDMSQPPTNVTLIKTEKDLILIDTGSGPNFMATAGRLADNLAGAGIAPEQVTKVLFTHGHPDHLWGTIDEFEDKPRFAKAAHLMADVEHDFWMSADAPSRMPADRASFVVAAQRNLKGVEGQLQRFKPGSEVVPGVAAVLTAGHTQGHVSFEVGGGPGPLVVLGDALTHPIISFQHPDWRPAADHEPERAVATRKALLDRLATDKSLVIGFHLPFPGIGRVERKDGGFRFVAGA